MHGEVDAISLPAYGAQRFVLQVEALGDPPVAIARPHALPVTLRLTGRSRWRWEELAPGTRLTALARLDRRADGVRAVITDRRAITIHETGAGFEAHCAAIRRRASWTFAQRLDPDDGGLARALLLGERGRLGHNDRTLFRETGQAHLLAVSGLHVGLLLAGVILLLRVVGSPLRVTWCLGLATAGFVVPFVGAPASAVRAGLGAVGWFAGALIGRPPRGLAVLTLVGLIVLLSDAANVRSVAFQLSFAAVTSILVLARPLRALLVRERPVIRGVLPPKRAPIRTSLAVSLAAWIGTAPLIATHMGRLCLAAALLSVPAIALTAVLLAAGAALLLFEDVDGVARASAWTFSKSATALRELLKLARDGGLSSLPSRAPTLGWCLLYAGAFALVARGGRALVRAGVVTFGMLLVSLVVPQDVVARDMPSRRSIVEGATYDARRDPMATLANISSTPDLLGLSAAALGLAVFGAAAVKARWLGPRAAVAAWVLGLASTAVLGWAALAALLAPFLAATVLGKLPGAPRAVARNVRQVLCNGVPALLGVALAASGRPDLGVPFFLGSLSCLGADTCATEVGVRWGGQPFRLVGRGRLQAGASGGVTAAGLLASLGGAWLAPLTYALILGGSLMGAGVLALAGVAAALIDSALGGTLQYRGILRATGTSSEDPSAPGVERVGGWTWLDNDAVNLVAGLAGGVLGVALAGLV